MHALGARLDQVRGLYSTTDAIAEMRSRVCRINSNGACARTHISDKTLPVFLTMERGQPIFPGTL